MFEPTAKIIADSVNPNFTGWNPHHIEDKNKQYWFCSIDDAIKTLLLNNPKGLTEYEIAIQLSANSLLIPQILNGVRRCLDDRNFRSVSTDWYCRKIDDKWYLQENNNVSTHSRNHCG